MGASRWFFSMSGLILLVCAIGDRGQGARTSASTSSRAPGSRRRWSSAATVDEVREAVETRGFDDAKIQTVSDEELGENVVQISTRSSGRDAGRSTKPLLDERSARAVDPDVSEIGPTFGEIDRELRDRRDHRLADRHRGLHRAALPVEVRRAGADRADARHPHHGGRLRPGRPGGDDVDGRGAAHHPRLLALRHDHRVRPHPREHAAHAERRVLADRQPLDERGDRALAGDLRSARCCRCSRCSSSAATR